MINKLKSDHSIWLNIMKDTPVSNIPNGIQNYCYRDSQLKMELLILLTCIQTALEPLTNILGMNYVWFNGKRRSKPYGLNKRTIEK